MADAPAMGSNPGYLKADLCSRGVILAPATRDWIEAALIAPRGALGAAVDLALSDDVWVRAPVVSDDPSSPYLLTGVDEQLVLQRDDSTVDVRLVPQPEYYGKTTQSGTPMWQVGSIYGGFIAITPASACSYSLSGAPCPSCRGESGSDGACIPATVDEVADVVRAAFAEGAAEFVYFNLPATGTEDEGVEFVAPYIRAIKTQFDTVVAVQLHPPAATRWIDRAYGLGVDAISYNLDAFQDDALSKFAPGRVARIGRDRYFESLAYAATVFPSGTVWSELIVGVEPTAASLAGIDSLTRLGVLPVLSLLDPTCRSAAGVEAAPDLDSTATLFRHLFQATRDAKINMGWVRDLSSAITPLEGRYFSPGDTRVGGALQQFYRSRLGSLAARNLARLRRRLRVRRVSDSFDSSHL